MVLPTRDRAALLPRADRLGDRAELRRTGSCDLRRRQRRRDGARSSPGSRDPRVRYLPDERAGVGAARNRGIDAAARRADRLPRRRQPHAPRLAQVGRLGVRAAARGRGPLRRDRDRGHRPPARRAGPRAAERLARAPTTRERISTSNVADTSAIAHRAGLPEARFDEKLETMGDWDLFAATDRRARAAHAARDRLLLLHRSARTGSPTSSRRAPPTGRSSDNARVREAADERRHASSSSDSTPSIRRLATELAAAGRLPAIARMLREGAEAETTQSLRALRRPPLWPTLATGRSATKLGYHNWLEVDPATYERRLKSGGGRRARLSGALSPTPAGGSRCSTCRTPGPTGR